jgi:hypothetical protein
MAKGAAYECLDYCGRYPRRIGRWNDERAGSAFQADPRQIGRDVDVV